MRTNNAFLAIALTITCSAIGFGQAAPRPVPADCDHKGVEVHTFYGSSTEVLRSLDRLPKDMSETRVYAMLLESKGSAEVRLYERQADGQFKLSSWKGKTLGQLRETMDGVMLRTRGLSCAGEELKRSLASGGFSLQHRTVGQPATMRVAFGDSVERYSEGTLRVSILHPCITPPPVKVAGIVR